jgi:hypothetical protein
VCSQRDATVQHALAADAEAEPGSQPSGRPPAERVPDQGDDAGGAFRHVPGTRQTGWPFHEDFLESAGLAAAPPADQNLQSHGGALGRKISDNPLVSAVPRPRHRATSGTPRRLAGLGGDVRSSPDLATEIMRRLPGVSPRERLDISGYLGAGPGSSIQHHLFARPKYSAIATH